ncbi:MULTISPECIES: dihydrofolate reductase family protein [unclassified Modestobacter]|uniref:dihydrofolate reductase family protein n=1 Tax=unclassified Modestobacter TaxID=2643866 RepID=UPI0022AAD904|nr:MULTISPECIES: dihydrofolate reductase family protein [unclassified Modestobacter]MCZ2825831.1 dihydrofolate reductase family protein [Modestobacter sp. VKM Ac-2981]MCZ2853104.1 dihydrofolate reductase family protein [Modestobacter sp. VKM Ac-2982]
MTRTVYYTATSLDGFIATVDHSLDWLLSRENDAGGPMGYDGFIPGIGALAMGATTYLWVREHDPDWLPEKPAWVFTHRDLTAPPGADLRFTAEDPARVHAAMVEAAAGRDVWVVGGGDLAGQFADRGLLDEVVVAIAPVTLGGGAPLLPRRVELVVRESARNGEFVCVRHDVVRPADAGPAVGTPSPS